MKVYLLSQKGINKEASEDRILVGTEVFSDQEAVRFLNQGHIMIADGVGGNNAGAVAAFQVCKKMADTFDLNPEAFSAINAHLFSMGAANESYRNMATTATGMLFSSEDTAKTYHVGNTRLYAIQAGEYLKQLTSDDTVVDYLIRTGKLTEDEAANYPARNEITSCFGGGKQSLLRVKLDKLDLSQYQQFLLTCDGIHDYLDTDEMEEILGQSDGDWASAIRSLIARAKDKGSPDDCSAVIIDCDPTLVAPSVDCSTAVAVDHVLEGIIEQTVERYHLSNSEQVVTETTYIETSKPTKNKLWNFFKKAEKEEG